LLKTKIVAMMQVSYPGINPSISEWKGQEITDFQEDLRIRVNANISEKWFYTHMKSSGSSMPRIDMLNLLARYAGYLNWDDFVFKNREEFPSPKVAVKTFNRYFILIPVGAVAVVIIFYLIFILINKREYQFTFRDADTQELLKSNRVTVRILLDGESPKDYNVAPDGRFHLKTDKSKIRMVVTAPYYQVDTISRILRKFDTKETIFLHANDYALMLHYFSKMKVGDWEKRKSNLERMFDEEALICQVFSDRDATGMELFNKKEFIDRLTMPSGSLKNIEILDSRQKQGKIILLRFRVNSEKR
jgi:hypothetical protein